jgi:hypothetical protein
MHDEWTAAMRAHDFSRAWQINDRDLAGRLANTKDRAICSTSGEASRSSVRVCSCAAIMD